MNIRKEIIIGVLSFIAIFAAIWGYKFLSGENLFKNDKQYFTIYNNIGQLMKSAPVLINGYEVGSVTDITLLPKSNNALKVTYIIKNEINIPKNSTADIISTSIMGGKAIQLTLNGYCEGSDCIENGAEIQGRTRGMIESVLNTNDLNKYISSAASGVSSFIDSLDYSLEESAQKNGIGSTVEDAKLTMRNIKTASQQIYLIMENLSNTLPKLSNNLESITSNIKSQNENINTTLSNLKAISEDLKNANLSSTVSDAHAMINTTQSTIKKLESTLSQFNGVLESINSGQGSMGMLVKDKELYKNLEASTASLNALLIDLKENPRRYVHFSIFNNGNK